jgi:hypothetical protein
MAHLGNAQAPLFSGINTFNYWCEPNHASCGPAGWPNRPPAASIIKAVADAYRHEQYWALMERFVPLRMSLGNTNFQIANQTFHEPIGEPITQHVRYLMLQNVAMHPTVAVWGLRSMVARGYFGRREMDCVKQWIRFCEEHAADLYHRPHLPAGEPGYGKVEVYSYGDAGGGWVFLINPHYQSEIATLRLGQSTGFNSDRPYAIREVSPRQRWRTGGQPTGEEDLKRPVVRRGENLTINVPAYTVLVLCVQPADTAWKSEALVAVGAELDDESRPLGLPGEWVDYHMYYVQDPVAPKYLISNSGLAPGSSPRHEMKVWRVLAGGEEENHSKGFQGGQRAEFVQEPRKTDSFRLGDFAGVALWDLAVDPVLDRRPIDRGGLLPPIPEPRGASHSDQLDSKPGWWLTADVTLDELPKTPVAIAQIAFPERVKVRMWINGEEQPCERPVFDWLATKPQGLRAGKNTIVLHLSAAPPVQTRPG